LATGKYIFIDNYHVVLAACNFRKDVTCTQLWHANGAVKYFGWRDKTIASRPDSAYKRFEKVYSRFHNFAVSSDEMAYIFGEAFNSKGKYAENRNAENRLFLQYTGYAYREK